MVLEWETGDDLDLHAKCVCDDEAWTTTPYNIECDECSMSRDVDMRTGKHGRKATEHIYFADTKRILGKEIGAYVENHLPQVQDGQDEVEFTLYALNRYGVVIWPEPKVKTIEKTEWMRCGMENGDKCDYKTFAYTEEMDKMGIINFSKRLEQVTRNQEVGWEITEAQAASANQD